MAAGTHDSQSIYLWPDIKALIYIAVLGQRRDHGKRWTNFGTQPNKWHYALVKKDIPNPRFTFYTLAHVKSSHIIIGRYFKWFTFSASGSNTSWVPAVI
jgi:hypothetical protein